MRNAEVGGGSWHGKYGEEVKALFLFMEGYKMSELRRDVDGGTEKRREETFWGEGRRG